MKFIPAILTIIAAGSGLTIYVVESKPPHPPSAIVALFAQQGGNPEDTDVRDVTAYLMRPNAAALRSRINAACAPLEVNPKVDWIDSTEGKVCRAAAEARNWAEMKPTPRDGFGLTTWP
jgi:hypothetical protein